MKNLSEDEIAEFIKTAFQILVGFDKYKMMDFILDSPYRIEQLNKPNVVRPALESVSEGEPLPAEGQAQNGSDGPYEYEMFFDDDGPISIHGWYPIATDRIRHPDKIEHYLETGLLRKIERGGSAKGVLL